MTWIVLGASSGLGRALAERLASERKDLLLVARDVRDLEPLAQDLINRFRVNVVHRAVDATNLEELQRAIKDGIEGQIIEGLLFPLGVSDDRDRATDLPEHTTALIATNFGAVVEVVRLFLPQMLERRSGTIVGFGSVAATRGRTSNAVYAASKAALRSFFESLRHGCEPSGVRIHFYTLGYLDTNLAFGRKLLFPKAKPAAVAETVVRNLSRRGGTWYVPAFWKPIALIVRLLPWPIFRRLDF